MLVKSQTIQRKTPDEIIANWTTYKNWYLTSGEQVSEVYEIFDGELYILSSKHKIKDGLLHEMITIDNENAGINYIENRYLSNASVGLYTRYKYDSNLEGKWDPYKIVSRDGSLFSGEKVYLIETAKVYLNGGRTQNPEGGYSGGIVIE